MVELNQLNWSQTVGDPGDQQTYPPLQGNKKETEKQKKTQKSHQLKDLKRSKRWFHHLIEVLQIVKEGEFQPPECLTLSHLHS